MRSITLIIFFLCPLILIAKDDARDILLKSCQAMQKQHSVSYTATARLKLFSGTDTNTMNGKVFLTHDTKDTFFHGKMWYTDNDTFYSFTNGIKIYQVDKQNRSATSYDLKKGESWAIIGNTHHDVVWKYFMEPGALKEYADTANTLTMQPDTIVNGHTCYAILIKFPDEGDFTKHKRWLYINKEDYAPIFTKRKIKYQGNYQYNEILIHAYTFNNVPASRFAVKQIPSSYKVEEYKRKEIKPLEIGTPAPAIIGKRYSTMTDKTIDFKEHITVLDFWYTTCGPCIKAIPQMEKIKEKYAGTEVKVYGINTYDNDSIGIARLPKFLEFNPIQYPIILVNRDLPAAYHIQGWPTFYIIDTEGKVAYSSIGASDKVADEISSVVDKLRK